MNRFSIGLTDDQLAYVEERTDETTSRADVIRAIIDANRSGSNQTGADTEPDRTESVSDLRERVDDLAERLEAVEEAIQEGGDSKRDESFKSDHSQAESGALSRGDADRMEHLAPPEEMDGSDPDDAGGGTEAGAGVPDDVRSAVDVDAIPSTVDTDAALVAIAAARDYIRARGEASMRQIVTDVMPDHSLGYDVPELEEGDRYRGSWWRKVVKPGLAALEDVEQPPGGQPWRYVGEGGGDSGGVYDPTDEF